MINNIINFIEKNWIIIIILAIILLLLCWIIGYFSNGIYSTKFELSSVWQGILALSSGGVIGISKFFIDSKYNSDSGKSPNQHE